MPYVPQIWNDYPAGGTPTSAARFTYMEDGIHQADITDPITEAAVSLAANYIARSQLGQQTLQNVNSIALRGFRAALSNRNNARCDIMHIGDGHTWGYMAAADGAASLINRWPSIVRNLLRSRYPNTVPVTGGRGYVSPRQTFSGVTMSDSQFSYGGTPSWTNTYGLDLNDHVLNSTGTSSTFSFTGTGIDFNYVRLSGGGTFSYAVDGGSATNVNTSNGSTINNNVIQIRSLADTTHTIVLTYVSGGNCYAGGYYVYRGDESVGIGSWPVAYPGTTAAYWNTSNWGDNLPWAAPDLVTIELGSEDWAAGGFITAAQFKTNLKALIATVKSKLGYNPSIVLMPTWPRVAGGNSNTWDMFVTAMYEVAIEDPNGVVCVFDARMRVNTVGNGTVANGILNTSDTTHLSVLGHRYIGESLVRFLEPQ